MLHGKRYRLTNEFASAMANTLAEVSSTRSYFTDKVPEDNTAPAVTNVKTAVPKNSLNVSYIRDVSLFHATSSGKAGFTEGIGNRCSVNLYEDMIFQGAIQYCVSTSFSKLGE